MRMDVDEIRSSIAELRLKWREVRDERLNLKTRLMSEGKEISSVRSDREFCSLKKKQRHLTILMRQLEKRLNRKLFSGKKN